MYFLRGELKGTPDNTLVCDIARRVWRCRWNRRMWVDKGSGTRAQLEVEHLDQLIPSKVVMLRNAIKDGLECPDLERIVSRDGNVMLALNLRGQSHMRTGLATLNVFESAQSLG